jgi:hypothetical protein
MKYDNGNAIEATMVGTSSDPPLPAVLQREQYFSSALTKTSPQSIFRRSFYYPCIYSHLSLRGCIGQSRREFVHCLVMRGTQP